jgi:hypothetical protein
MVECLPNKHEALNSNSCTTKKQNKKIQNFDGLDLRALSLLGKHSTAWPYLQPLKEHPLQTDQV